MEPTNPAIELGKILDEWRVVPNGTTAARARSLQSSGLEERIAFWDSQRRSAILLNETALYIDNMAESLRKPFRNHLPAWNRCVFAAETGFVHVTNGNTSLMTDDDLDVLQALGALWASQDEHRPRLDADSPKIELLKSRAAELRDALEQAEDLPKGVMKRLLQALDRLDRHLASDGPIYTDQVDSESSIITGEITNAGIVAKLKGTLSPSLKHIMVLAVGLAVILDQGASAADSLDRMLKSGQSIVDEITSSGDASLSSPTGSESPQDTPEK